MGTVSDKDFADVLFIVNPISGKGGRKARIISALEKAGCRIVYTEYASHAEKIAAEAIQNVVVAVGGDGTVNEVARGIMGTDKMMGILPCGSGDGLARKLGLRVCLSKALSIIRKRKLCRMDCAVIDGKPFFSVCGVGLDAIVSERFANAGKRGLFTYVREAVRAWRSFAPDHYEISIDGRTLHRDAVLITVGNSNQWGNGAKITPKALVDDGQLDITVVKMFRTLEIPAMVLYLMTGIIHRYPRVECFRGKDIRISRTSEGPAHFDGDFMQAGRDVDIKLLPSKLNVIIP